jgi:hypothetical protein
MRPRVRKNKANFGTSRWHGIPGVVPGHGRSRSRPCYGTPHGVTANRAAAPNKPNLPARFLGISAVWKRSCNGLDSPAGLEKQSQFGRSLKLEVSSVKGTMPCGGAVCFRLQTSNFTPQTPGEPLGGRARPSLHRPPGPFGVPPLGGNRTGPTRLRAELRTHPREAGLLNGSTMEPAGSNVGAGPELVVAAVRRRSQVEFWVFDSQLNRAANRLYGSSGGPAEP